MPYTKGFAKTIDSFEMLRGETRSVFFPNKIWEEILKQSHGICSASEYIRMAVVEKMIKDEPQKKDYFIELLN